MRRGMEGRVIKRFQARMVIRKILRLMLTLGVLISTFNVSM